MCVKTFVIAEIGSCHENSLDTAYNLILTAKTSGANAVKAQYWSSSKRLAERRNIPAAEPIYAKYKIPLEWLEKLSTHAEKVGIEFMCSTYLPQDIGVVAPYVQKFKVSAFENDWEEFVNAHPKGKPIIISNRLDSKVRWLGQPYQRLHVVSEYPTPLGNLGLRRGLYQSSGNDGISLHCPDVRVGAWAVCAGAKIIEAHIKLEDTEENNPDYPHSFDTIHFREFVGNIRDAEVAL